MRTSAVAGRFGLLGFLAFVGIGPLFAPSDAAAQSCMVTTPIGPINDVGTGVAIQPDGKILLSGSMRTVTYGSQWRPGSDTAGSPVPAS